LDSSQYTVISIQLTKNIVTDFQKKVYAVVKRIPRGKTLTYKQVAKLAGSPKAFRAVGNVLNKNYDPNIPCHRVVRSDGQTGGYNRGASKKAEILMKEVRTES
jgi:methylated-DNA-[protein]-cysteine S-methyltransferase